MGHYARLRRKPSTFRQLTGLSVAAFDELLAQREPALAARTAEARRSRPPERKAGAGRTPKLAVPERLSVSLTCRRVSVSQAFPGGLFGVDAGTVRRRVTAIGLARTGVVRIPGHPVAVRKRGRGKRTVRAATGEAAAGRRHTWGRYDRSRRDGVRRAGDSGYRRTRVLKLVKRAGLTASAKPFHNLRASCETDLVRNPPRMW